MSKKITKSAKNPVHRWIVAGGGALAIALTASAYSFADADAAAQAQPGLTSGYAGSVPAVMRRGGPSLIDYARLDRRLQQVVATPGMVGMAVAIVENGELRFVKGYGVTQYGTHDPVTTRTVFRWASLSKGVAATTVASLAADGKISLNAPISRYSSSLKLPGGAENRLTVTDLLAQRLGIVRNAYDGKLEAGQDPRVLRTQLATAPMQCAAGGCYSYQNIAYDAASEMVERVTGRRYEDVVRERIFLPLGMTSATISRQGLQSAPSWARSHVGTRVMPVVDSYYRVPAAGGVNSSIIDMGRWMQAQMGVASGVVSPGLLKTIHAPLTVTGRARGFGIEDRAISGVTYGMGFREYAYAGHQLVGHRGAVRGYRSLMVFDPVQRTGVAILWNSQSTKPVGLQLEVLDMLYGLPTRDWLKVDLPGTGNARTLVSATADTAE
ncbi:serine hydrolase domain-containing protein [Sphingomonas sanxanigenens]|uniref:Beta-lactamase-related domain-containing protein n=1 Tax=Sphingomonas sanxanigenens DSM 19645 = NX02 TaxID=1123269 RepID=W0AB59_9SPHN|nr:serine hydrolase domain-containing protein [Sphingomonas sanxanigenens]AHE52905.1 hypothetical protein NX02_05850 [Sphingomonas sanxanigenens DSM 19645 = NX02]